MSQAQEMAAIDNLFARTIPTNVSAAALRDTWAEWYDGLSTYERDYDSDVLYDAKARRDAFNRAVSVGTVVAPAPIPIIVASTPKPFIKEGSKDPKGSTNGPVREWQTIVGAIPVDGEFGPDTKKLTKKWQKAHGLYDDGEVGPLTWAQALANSQAVLTTTGQSVATTAANAAAATAAAANPTAAGKALNTAAQAAVNAMTNPPASAAVKNAEVDAASRVAADSIKSGSTVSSSTFPVLRLGSKGENVKKWQLQIGISPADGNFGTDTETLTKKWQKAHGIDPDGVVGAVSWSTAALPGAGTVNTAALMIDPAGRAWTAAKGAFDEVMNMTPPWLKVVGGLSIAWSALLLFTSGKPKTDKV